MRTEKSGFDNHTTKANKLGGTLKNRHTSKSSLHSQDSGNHLNFKTTRTHSCNTTQNSICQDSKYFAVNLPQMQSYRNVISSTTHTYIRSYVSIHPPLK